MTFTPNTRFEFVAGGEAGGSFALPSIKEGDLLLKVFHFAGDGTKLTGVEDLTDEFKVEEDEKLKSVGNTNTTNGFLFVFFWSV